MGIHTVVPEVLVAGGDGLDACGAMVDGQMERDGAVATHGVLFNIGGRGSAGGVDDAVPGVAVAGSDSLGAGGGIVNSEVEGGDAVAT